MALICCPECKREISDKAEACPQCGFPIAKELGPVLPETVDCLECKKPVPFEDQVCPHCGLFNSQKYTILEALNPTEEIETRPEEDTDGQKNKLPLDNKNLPKSYVVKVIIAVVGVFALIGYCSEPSKNSGSNNTTASTAKVKSPEELRKERIEQGFSPWDGSHRKLEELIKKNMKDPDSYKHDETRYIDRGDYLIVSTRFRGKNAFGAMMPNTVKAKCDLDGNVLQILSQEAE